MKTSYWLAAACLVTSTTGFANDFNPVEIKDEELAQLRGRYVMPGRVISFGVVMSSTWRNASGDLIGAATTMQIQAATVKPQFYVSTIKERGNGRTPTLGSGTVLGGASLNASQAITQVTRAAGDDNTANNSITIDVKEASIATAPLPAQGEALVAGQTITGNNAAGSVAVSATGGGVQMAITANNNQGSSLHKIAQSGLVQNTRLQGNNNMVNNLTQLSVILNNDGSGTGGQNFNLNQLTALRTQGY